MKFLTQTCPCALICSPWLQGESWVVATKRKWKFCMVWSGSEEEMLEYFHHAFSLVPWMGTSRKRESSAELVFPFKIASFFHRNKKSIRKWIMKADSLSSKLHSWERLEFGICIIRRSSFLIVLFLNGGGREARDYNCPFIAFFVLVFQQAARQPCFLTWLNLITQFLCD